jgi:taspase (threonine aspartase 1)
MDHEGSSRQRDHINAISTATWNEGQPDSPAASSPSASEGLASFSSRSSSTSLRLLDKSPLAGAIDSIRAAAGQEPAVARRVRSRILRPERPGDAAGRRDDHRGNNRDGPGSCRTSLEASVEAQFALDVGDALDAGAVSEGDQDAIADEEALHSSVEALPPLGPSSDSDEDEINDTIGAIAVDEHGHLAAASSSGGIGMKHRGRVGPAALVGIGTAVVPGTGADPEVSVAAVTSGTGEHMATTMASRRCAERIFSGTRMGAGGRDMIEPDDDSIMRSFIRDDFMGHPGVASCHSAGAIGVMVVKRTRGGIYFYFAHNTDSFALASMGGRDQVPVSVMSRLRESGRDGGAALGGRRVVV